MRIVPCDITALCKTIPALLLTAVMPFFVSGQSLALPQGNKHQPFLDRLEILLQRNPELNLFSPKEITRHTAVHEAGLQDSSSGNPSIKLSAIDQYNLRSLLMNNAEWVTTANEKKHAFYNNAANMVEANSSKFFFALNPVIQGLQSKQQDFLQGNASVYHYAGGLSLRGMVGGKFGFYAYGTKNYESPPMFVQDRIAEFRAVPGANDYSHYGARGYQYYDLRGGITFRALKFFDVQAGYDRNFIGNGYRSLFLSDFAGSYPFIKVNTKVWKLNYQNLYTGMVSQYSTGETKNFNVSFPRKFVAVHHLSINAAKWLNIGLFHSLVINERKQFLYLNPVIFFSVSSFDDSRPANSISGLDFKANIAKRAQVYGQLLLDQIRLKEITAGNGWWGNRYGYQLGLKYINLFGINNLDLQAEVNAVRPFTYAAADSLDNFSHYNQPLAHPMGANFAEFIGILRYQPTKRLTATGKLIYWAQGVDSSAASFGGNIFKSYGARVAEYGYTIPSGMEGKGLNMQLQVSYELAENIFLDATAMVRRWKVEDNSSLERKVNIFTAGLRMNIFRKEYDY
ncbi:MAG: hypothetical protein ABI687_05815 [Flavitalea sp.]